MNSSVCSQKFERIAGTAPIKEENISGIRLVDMEILANYPINLSVNKKQGGIYCARTAIIIICVSLPDNIHRIVKKLYG